MEPAEAHALLRQVKILAPVSDGELAALAQALTWRRVRAGEDVVSHLDHGAKVYFVVHGAFRARLEAAIGRQVSFRHFTEGSHFGEIAALTNTPRSLSISAQIDGLLAECPGPAFLALMDGSAAFAAAVAAHLARTVLSLTDRVFELAVLEVRFRIYAELLRLAASGAPTDAGVLVIDAPTHKDIAESVGAQREAVTRELRILASEGLIRQTKRELLILDIDRLRELVRRRAGATTSEALDWRL